MKFVFASYAISREFKRPEDWIKRINAYSGVLESLSKQHTVISIEQIDYEGEHQQNGVQYYFMDSGKRKSYFPCRLHRCIKNLKPDIVIIRGLHFPLQVIQLRLRLGNRVKIIAQSHGDKTPKGYKKFLQKIADKCIDAYFFTSKIMSADWVNNGLIANDKKIMEVMTGSSVFHQVNKEAARLRKGVQGQPVFLWVGRLNKNKDPVTVINAFLQFAISNPAARLYMIYHSTELLSEIKNINNKSKEAIVLIGKVTHDEMLDWFNSADFFVSGSHFEVFGMAVSEAMSCGCVPILTNIPSFLKITGNGSCGLLYQAGNQNSLLAALMQAVRMDMEQEKEKVRKQFEGYLSFEAIGRRIHEVAISL